MFKGQRAEDQRHRFVLRAAQLLLGLFGVCIVVEHVASARLSPLTHQISEYANAKGSGWLMTIGFFAWAFSLILGAEAVRSTRTSGSRRRGETVVVWMLRIAGLAMLITASFHTETVAGAIPAGEHLTTSGRLHDVGSGTTTLALAIGAIASLWMTDTDECWFRVATSLGLAFAVVVDVALLLVGSSVGGLRERALLMIGFVWQICLYRVVDKRQRSRPVRG